MFGRCIVECWNVEIAEWVGGLLHNNDRKKQSTSLNLYLPDSSSLHSLHYASHAICDALHWTYPFGFLHNAKRLLVVFRRTCAVRKLYLHTFFTWRARERGEDFSYEINHHFQINILTVTWNENKFGLRLLCSIQREVLTEGKEYCQDFPIRHYFTSKWRRRNNFR